MTSPEAELDRLSASDSDRDPSLAELFRAYHGELVRLATMLVRSREMAEDVVQDVLASIQGKAGGLARPEEAPPYLRAAVLNRCRSALRRQAVARRFGDLRDPDYGLTRVSAETSVVRDEERREALAALAVVAVAVVVPGIGSAGPFADLPGSAGPPPLVTRPSAGAGAPRSCLLALARHCPFLAISS